MSPLIFDEAGLVSRLTSLRPGLRAVFAALCARRLVAMTESEAVAEKGVVLDLGRLAERIWDSLESNSLTNEVANKYLDAAMDLVADDESDTASKFEEDAASALAYTCRAWITQDPQEAAWAARRAYEAVDRYVIRREGIEISVSGAEEIVVGHVLVQAELRRQESDLQALETLDDAPDAASELKKLLDEAKNGSDLPRS